MYSPAKSPHSIWARDAISDWPALAMDLTVDVCVVGAGIAGLSTAYHLHSIGKSVAVLDAGDLTSGESMRTSAHLACVADDRFINLERTHGGDGARLFAESHAAAIDRIELITRQQHIECDFKRVDGYLFQPADEASTDFLEHEMAAAQRAGLAPESLLESPPAIGFDIGPCLRFPNQAQFNPMKYLSGLAKYLQANGVLIHGHTRVVEVQGGDQAYVKTEKGQRVSCAQVVVATNTPFNNRYVIHTKQAAYRTYVVAFTIPVNTIETALYWDTIDPYHYVRLVKNEHGPDSTELLIVGGEDHRTGQEDDPAGRFARLESWTRRRFPLAGKVAYHWSGQVLEPVDGVAFIGRNPLDEDNIYIATGDSGMGLTHGTIAGMLIADLIAEKENPWAKLYDPSRKSLGSIGEYARENFNTAVQYTDWLTGSDVDELEKIEPGSGAVVRKGMTKVAVHRDEAGNFHQCSAVCPHLGGIVAWNDVEKSWDCPCHGSRFDADGTRICGPAVSSLKQTDAIELPVLVGA